MRRGEDEVRGNLIIAFWTSLILHYGERRQGILLSKRVCAHSPVLSSQSPACRKRTEPSLLLFYKSRLLTREDPVVTLLCVRSKCCLAAAELSRHLQGALGEQSSLLPERKTWDKCLPPSLSFPTLEMWREVVSG